MARALCEFTKWWLRNQGGQNVVCFSSRPQKERVSPFVPLSSDVSSDEILKLQDFIDTSKRLLVLTGAGISTESGIPDYRSEGVGLYATSTNRPVQYTDFLKNAEIRQRYWARNYVGWPRFSSFVPNIGHKVLSKWEKQGKVHWLVTQNVDALHYKAQSLRVTELHGSAHRVVCLSCKKIFLRTAIQKLIEARNPTWHASSVDVAPDGDVSLTPEQIMGFKVPECQHCGGILKPEIVFFGDSVPKPTVEFVFDRLSESDAMLVVGSSLETWTRTAFFWKKKDKVLQESKPAPADPQQNITTTKVLKKKTGLQTVPNYTPPLDLEARIEKITKDVCGDIKDWRTHVFENNHLKFKILTRLITEFDHNIPSVDLTDIHSAEDAIKFFSKPVRNSSMYEDLAKLDLPKNLHIQLDPLRFDPATDTMFGGISAFPDRPTIVGSIRYKKKYGKKD